MRALPPKILFLLLGSLAICPTAMAQKTAARKFQGFIGSYHPFNGTAFGGDGWIDGESIQQAFNFGENAIISQAGYNGYTFAENAENNCRDWDVNKLYGILRPPTEKGVVNQPKDNDPLKPFNVQPGMIQGAHRFSELSKTCPQLTGVIVDDFFNDYPKLLSAEDVLDIKDALLGKPVDAEGNVDHSAPATTPHLKLYIVVYEHQLEKPIEKEVLNAVDGVSFWTWKQNENFRNFDTYIDSLQNRFPGKEIIAGVYVYNGAQTPSPESVHYIFERAIDLYGSAKLDGLLIFSAIWMSRERSTRQRWDDLGLPHFLDRVYYPFLGEALGRVVDARTKKPIAGALVTVMRNIDGRSQLVARKFTGKNGEYRFGGWAAAHGKYRLSIEDGSSTRHLDVKLHPGESKSLPDVRLGK